MAPVPQRLPGTLQLMSWNVAAINNNPFEYWLTHGDPDYAKLMEDVEKFVEAPGDLDVPVKEVFTPSMYDSLSKLMTEQGWDGEAACTAAWEKLSERKIISEFLKDAELGNKRLMSMPDRFSNTIDVEGGGSVFRPSVISSFSGDMGSLDAWWSCWTNFFFTTKIDLPGKGKRLPCSLLKKIPRAKYPALTEEEEAMSQRLQTVCLAVFDAILVHMLTQLSPGGKWLALKRQILQALVSDKESKLIAIFKGPYATTDLFFLQEVRTEQVTSVLPAALGDKYVVVGPPITSKANQNSCMLLSKACFDPASITDLTKEAMALQPSNGAQAADGDLVVVSATDLSGQKLLLASFHGDTDGLATATVLAAVHALATTRPEEALIFGLDANTYVKAKPGKQAGAAEFIADFKVKGYGSNYGDKPLVECLTTSNARTYLQPQLQKACKASDKQAKGDFNPKDYLLFSAAKFELIESGKDNTGQRAYTEGMVVPTFDWPSDHGCIFATLKLVAPVAV
uniref:Endonuclease/exonuclease/phosphatase domain-containing protein n=1 Tax=Haptolina brevifila TaxID=156173 RepID=A0A7S2I847_9EUKA